MIPNAFTISPADENKGFMMRLDNGIRVSVRFGLKNYCDQGVTTAECAAWIMRGNERRVWVQVLVDDLDHDSDGQVVSYMTVNDVLKFLNAAAAIDVTTISNERLTDGF